MTRARVATVTKLAAGCVLAISLATGCGSNGSSSHALSKAAYNKKLSAIRQDVKALPMISASASGASDIQKIRAGLRKAADRVSRLSPPKDAKADNDHLVSGIRQFADALGPIQEAAKARAPIAYHRALTKLLASSAVRNLRAATNALASKGYTNLG
jgi:hypothetical protein